MADATVNVVNGQAVVQPFGSEMLVPLVAAASTSATLSQAWAEGTNPGGGVTKSAKEWATAAAAAVADVLSRLPYSAFADGTITIGSADGAYAFRLGPAGIDFRADPAGEIGTALTYLTSLKSMVNLSNDDGITFGSADGKYALKVDASGVHFVGQSSVSTGSTALAGGVVYEATVSSKQQVMIGTGTGVAQISDGTANDTKPQILGGHVRFLSDRYAATPREFRMLPTGKSPVSAYGTPTIYLGLAMGQSTSIGSMSAGSAAAITTTANYNGSVLRFNRGVRVVPPVATTSSVVSATDIDRLVPLTETFDTAQHGETHLGNLMYRLFAASQARGIAATVGVGGAAYVTLKKGTVPYANGMAVVQKAQDICAALGWSLVVFGTWDQGEADSGDTALAYSAKVQELYAALDADVRAITGQSAFHLFVAQTSSLTASGVPIGQWLASKAVPNVHCVGPRYDLPYADSQHPTSVGYNLLGDIYYRAVKAVVIDGAAWKPLQPLSAVRSGATITVTFEGQTGNVVSDTTGVAAITNLGVEYFDDTSSATISSVTQTSTGCTVTLSATPTGTNPKLRFAYTRPGTLPTSTGGARTNFADSDTLSATYDSRAMPKRLVHSEIVVS